MKYDKKFVDKCQELYNKIKENRPIKECLNYIKISEALLTHDIGEIVWFLYYMFFAIHNPKMEDYIQKKMLSSDASYTKITTAWWDIMKNMIKRRNYTSTIVFRLYTYSYTTQSTVTHVYPRYKDDPAKQLVKSYQSNHLKTTVVLTRRIFETHHHQHQDLSCPIIETFLEYLITTAPTISTASTSADVIRKISNIQYKRKDIIVLALLCYMKMDEDDINHKNIFIAATQDEMNQHSDDDGDDATTTTSSASSEQHKPLAEIIPTTATKYEDKYKYLYT